MNRHIKKITVFLFLFSICFSLLVSLSGVKDAEASEAVTYRLKWLFNASVIGDIYADVQGHFKTQGLDVTVKEGGPKGMPSENWNWDMRRLVWRRPTR